MLPRTTRSWSNIGKFTWLTSHLAVACVSWSITWTPADAQLTIFMVLCTHTQMTDIDILSLHCKSDSLVVRNATQLDRKHVVILRAGRVFLPSCKQRGWVRTSVDDGQEWAIGP